MKRADLLRHIESHGCVFVREAGSTPFIAIRQTDKRQLFLATGKLRTILPERFATIWEYPGFKPWAVSGKQ
jgi:hypothetical protein